MSDASSDGARTRQIAADLVQATLKQRQTLDETFAREKQLEELTPSDRGLVRALVSATFRELGRLDAGLSPLVERPFEELDPILQAFLRIGAVQLWRLDTPAHAAVAATVEAARQVPASRRGAGLINAVLRRAAEDRSAFDAAPILDVWPTWLQAEMIDSLGEAGARDLATAQLTLPKLHLTARDPGTSATDLNAEHLPSGTLALPMTSVETLPGYAEGDWWVQDAGAALPARILAAQPGEIVIDLGAAPGGKTQQLAATGAHVIAVDRSAARLKRLRENLERTRLSGRVEVVAARGEDWRPDTPVDAVLLDAPCSALGTLARHPEGAWIKRPQDLTGYPKIQAELLAAAHEMLKPGGRLIYCVCTPLRDEGVAVITAALETGRWSRDPINESEVTGFQSSLTPSGDVLTLPGSDGGHDTFFIARLRK